MGNLAPLGALSGAAGGMADAVAGIIEQRLRQTQVANQVEETKARLQETANQNAALNQYRADQLQATIEGRIATQQDTKSRNDEVARKDFLGTLHTTPIGTPITPDEQTRAIAAGQPAGSFTQYQPPNMGMSTPQGEVGPSAAQSAGLWRGTQAQIEQANKDAIDRRTVPLGPVERDAQGNFFRIGPDGVKNPVTDEQGNPIKGYQAPVQPVVIQTDSGPMFAPKGGGNARPILGPDGQPVGPKSSAQSLDRIDRADRVAQHYPDVQAELDEANKRGLLGPLAGRTFTDFLAGKVGSTGNKDDDALLGELRNDLGLYRSGVASLHGRAGANAGIANKIEQKMDEGHMSYEELSGGLKALNKWVVGYASKKPGGSTPSGSTGDPLVDRLNQRRQQQ